MHLVFVGWLTLRPLSVPWVAPANLHPLATIRPSLLHGSREGLTGLAVGVSLLAPLGVLLPLAAGRLHRPLPGTVARTVFWGALVSSAIVLLQSGVPGQRVNVDCVLLNTSGVAAAALLVLPPVRAWLRHRDRPAAGGGAFGPRRSPVVRGGVPPQEDPAAGATPTGAGVGIAP